MRKPIRWILAGAALVVLFAFVVFFFGPARAPVVVPLPQPNGYDDFVRAGALVTKDLPDGWRNLNEAELRPLTAGHAAALKFTREGFTKECRVPVGNSTNHLIQRGSVMRRFRQLTLAFLAEGRLAELELRPGDAANSYVDAIRLGHECARGGLLLDNIVGRVFENMGSSALARMVGGLEAKDCRAVLARLDSIESLRESPNETLRVERAWSRQADGLQSRLSDMMQTKSFDPVKAHHLNYLTRLQVEIARQSQLRIDLATRAYQLEHGKPPASVNDLVPAYLKALPPNPATNAPDSGN